MLFLDCAPLSLDAMTFTGTDACGNSPKNMFVARFEEDLFRGDREALAEAVAEDCALEIVRAEGVETSAGRDDVVDALVELSNPRPSSERSERRPFERGHFEAGHLEAAITHGKAAAAWGRWEMPDGDRDSEAEARVEHFSHTFWFATLKAQSFAQIRVFQP